MDFVFEAIIDNELEELPSASSGASKLLPIEVEDEGGQYKFAGENYSDFIKLISNEDRKFVPFHYTSWQNVPDHFKKAIFPTLFEYFNLQSLRNTDRWEGIRHVIHAESQRAYKDRKQLFKKYFDMVGGYKDVEIGKSIPLDEMDQEAWEQLKRSEKKKSNRSKQRYTSFHESKSHSQRQHMEGTGGVKVLKKPITSSEKLGRTRLRNQIM
ncbi:hypothetical protein R6Q57_015993 [Mikania cordata]